MNKEGEALLREVDVYIRGYQAARGILPPAISLTKKQHKMLMTAIKAAQAPKARAPGIPIYLAADGSTYRTIPIRESA